MLTKEFLLILRDKQALLALFIMPAVFILIMSLALKDVFSEDHALVNYSIIDHDHSVQSSHLLSLLEENRLLEEQNLTSGREPQFTIVIPEGFGKLLSSQDKNSPPLKIRAAADVKQDLLSLFRAQVITALLQMRFETLKSILDHYDIPVPDTLNLSTLDAGEMLQVSYDTMEKNERPNSTQQSVPTWIVFGMFFIIIPMSTIFIDERKQNTLLRLLTMNVSTPVLFGGKIIPYLLINQLQVWAMIAVGIYLVPQFGAEALILQGSMPALMLVSLSLSFSAIGFSMLIAVSVKSVEQATTIGGILNVLLGAIGGVMVPKFVMPDFMQTFSNISPMSWGLEGFLDVLLRREGVEAVLPEVLALTLFGLILLILAAMIFKMKTRRGL
jgi:ABC-2 type transport system permease protein